jgi:hypothetical protein
MDYHAHRFTDHSLLFYCKNKLVAVLPANRDETMLYSHQGLTYGGLILSRATSTNVILSIFETLQTYLKDQHICTLIYKKIPYIYQQQPSDEDLYALFRCKATLLGRSIASVIDQQNKVSYSELRTRGIRKAQSKNLVIKEDYLFHAFWNILECNLSTRFGVAPVHSLAEIEYLKAKFPNAIRLFNVYDNHTVIAGCVVFETFQVAHVQYISASEVGKACGALDYLFDHLVQNVFRDKKYFDFGISTEQNGVYLNEGLIAQKEGFGARGLVYDVYELNTD